MDLQTIFKRLIANNKLSHAYLFWGAPEISFAENLANFMENGVWEKPKSPLVDFFVAGRAVGINEIKNAQHFLWQSPVKSTRKILVISEADKLTPQAQNAMLKITEEPPKSALLLAFVRNPDLLAPPLVSRFQKVYVARLQSPTAQANGGQAEALNFLRGSKKEKSDMIKELIEDSRRLEKFVGGVMSELAKDSVKNFIPLKELCYRWGLISRYNTNKRLQLEVWMESLIY